MTISRDVPIHGTGHTVGEILDAAAEAGGGGSGTGFVETDSGQSLVVVGADATASSPGQEIRLQGGNDSADQYGAGNVKLQGGNDVNGGGAGGVVLLGGIGTAANSSGGTINITSGEGAVENGNGGSVLVLTGAGHSSGHNAGDVLIIPGTGIGGARDGTIRFGLPTADPSVENAIWSDTGVLVQSGHTAPSGGVGFTEVDASNLALIPAVGVDVTINAGQDNSDAIGGGTIALKAGDDVQNGGAGNITLTAGQCVSDGAGAGSISLTAGAATVGNGLGGSIFLVSGQGVGAAAGGDIVLSIAGASGDGAPVGHIKLSGLPASDPSEGDAIWSDNGVLVQSGHTAGGSPQPGQPTRFLTLTYHHPGNEDGNSTSATTGIPIPDSTIAEGSLYAVSVQTKAIKSSDGSLVTVGFAPAVGASHTNSSLVILRETGGSTISFGLDNPIADAQTGTPSSFSNSPEANDDAQFYSAGVSVSGNALIAKFAGLSTNTPTDWTINVQLTPITP